MFLVYIKAFLKPILFLQRTSMQCASIQISIFRKRSNTYVISFMQLLIFNSYIKDQRFLVNEYYFFLFLISFSCLRFSFNFILNLQLETPPRTDQGMYIPTTSGYNQQQVCSYSMMFQDQFNRLERRRQYLSQVLIFSQSYKALVVSTLRRPNVLQFKRAALQRHNPNLDYHCFMQ